MNDFGSNPAPAAGSTKRGKAAESHGIATIELPNGQRWDGYVLITDKNAAKLGVNAEQLAQFVKDKKKATIGVEGGLRLHIQFGDKDLVVATPVELTFA